MKASPTHIHDLLTANLNIFNLQFNEENPKPQYTYSVVLLGNGVNKLVWKGYKGLKSETVKFLLMLANWTAAKKMQGQHRG